MLHDLLEPKVYLEVGVQYGLSLDLAHAANVAIGVDPNPLVAPKGNQIIFQKTSNEYFASFLEFEAQHREVDLAFIDGSHLWEDAATDFINIVPLRSEKAVIVFDDVLPYNNDIAQREPLLGDWTGDVWKVGKILPPYVEHLYLVDTFPTGTMVVYGEVDLVQLKADFFAIGQHWHKVSKVPDDVISRIKTHQPQWTINRIREDLWTSP